MRKNSLETAFNAWRLMVPDGERPGRVAPPLVFGQPRSKAVLDHATFICLQKLYVREKNDGGFAPKEQGGCDFFSQSRLHLNLDHISFSVLAQFFFVLIVSQHGR